MTDIVWEFPQEKTIEYALNQYPNESKSKVVFKVEERSENIAVRINRLKILNKYEPIGSAEIYVLAYVFDGHSYNNLHTIFKNSGKFNLAPDQLNLLIGLWEGVKEGDEIITDPILIYGPKTPGGFLDLQILVMESDSDIRQLGKYISQIFQERNVLPYLKQWETFSSMSNFWAVIQYISQIIQRIGIVMQQNGDDQVGFYRATFTARTDGYGIRSDGKPHFRKVQDFEMTYEIFRE